ncbi:hypothetical protein [Hymenobacter baengnokdamensis]|uniref:hypothetical protein n=1 Tax=Hymenobacter baengnokdamensis TaxID=2615203 RepID=UPI001244B210|nr:hypothetical protein [Hymenobacter baengnokdamensis]
MPASPAESLAITYEAEEGVLVGRWRRNHAEPDLPEVFELLVEAALKADHCRFWLLDLRERTWHPPAFKKWFDNLLSKQVVQVLGRPVFLACVATEQNRADIESIATQVRLRQHAQEEFYPYFFNNEGAARDWLLYHRQQEKD